MEDQKVKCEQCSFEAKNERGMLRHKSIHVASQQPQYVSQEQFSRLEKSVESMVAVVGKVVDGLEKKVVSQEIIAEREAIPDEIDATPIPPKWRAIVDTELDTDFGIQVRYPDNGSGFLFTIIVPLKKSNATKDYLERYKVDRRTVALSPNQGIDGIKNWCQRVRKNLERSGIKVKTII